VPWNSHAAKQLGTVMASKIEVTQAFDLSVALGESQHFDVGIYEVSEDIAEHWYVKQFSTIIQDVIPDANNNTKRKRPVS